MERLIVGVQTIIKLSILRHNIFLAIVTMMFLAGTFGVD
jgi:hypothetical protein